MKMIFLAAVLTAASPAAAVPAVSTPTTPMSACLQREGLKRWAAHEYGHVAIERAVEDCARQETAGQRARP